MHSSDTPAAGAAADPWARVLERIIQGFTHDLNNRLLVLMGVRDLLEPPAGADAGLLDLFDSELDGLEAENRLLRRLIETDTEVETCDPAAILADARALHRRHRGLHTVEVTWTIPDGLPAVRVVPSAALRALLLLLAGSAEAALDGGVSEVAVEVGVEGERVVVTPSPPPSAGSAQAGAAAAWLEAEWGELVGADGRQTLTLAAQED